MATLRARMRVVELLQVPPGGRTAQVRLTPTGVANPDDNGGWAQPVDTAAGGAQLVISNPATYDFFSYDSEYFVDFSPVPPPVPDTGQPVPPPDSGIPPA